MNTYFSKRNLYRVTIEMDSPLKIGTGEYDLETDSPIATDVNGLPYIPSTSLAGVFRHYLDSYYPQYKIGINNLFGSKSGGGSHIIFSEGKIIGEDGYPIDGIDIKNADPMFKYIEIPIRQHVRITEKGVAADKAKFDEAILIKGARFCFEMEVLSDNKEEDAKQEDPDNKRILKKDLVDLLLSGLTFGNIFIGGGTRRGFGKIKLIGVKSKTLDFTASEQDLKLYLDKSSNLRRSGQWVDADGTPVWVTYKPKDNSLNGSLTTYDLELEAKDFFIFSSGKENAYGDIGMTQAKEKIIVWEGEKPRLMKDEDARILIPASSVKGAISHRVAYRYNQRRKINANNSDGNKINEAVKYLFGCSDKKNLIRGNILFEDLFLEEKFKPYTLSHNKIDRLTGGTIGSALFHENPSFLEDGNKFKIRIQADYTTMRSLIVRDYPNASQEEIDDMISDIRKSFEATLKDIIHGFLPLGGGTNRGNGIFFGKLIIDNIKTIE